MVINITASVGAGDETTFNIVDSEGDSLNLTTLNATKVSVDVLDNDSNIITIDSEGDHVSFVDDTVTVKFGKLALRPSPAHYKPRISYVTSNDSDFKVLAGEDYATEINLKVAY